MAPTKRSPKHSCARPRRTATSKSSDNKVPSHVTPGTTPEESVSDSSDRNFEESRDVVLSSFSFTDSCPKRARPRSCVQPGPPLPYSKIFLNGKRRGTLFRSHQAP